MHRRYTMNTLWHACHHLRGLWQYKALGACENRDTQHPVNHLPYLRKLWSGNVFGLPYAAARRAAHKAQRGISHPAVQRCEQAAKLRQLRAEALRGI
jgi:hypothetical protein